MVLEATQFRLVGVTPSISQIVSKIAPIFTGISAGGRAVGTQISKGGLLAARARNSGPSATPVASNAIRTVSQLGKTRAGLNLSGRQITIIGTGALATVGTVALTQPGPGLGGPGTGPSAIQTITAGAKDISEDFKLPFEQITKFVQENGQLVALIGLGVVVIVLIK